MTDAQSTHEKLAAIIEAARSERETYYLDSAGRLTAFHRFTKQIKRLHLSRAEHEAAILRLARALGS